MKLTPTTAVLIGLSVIFGVGAVFQVRDLQRTRSLALLGPDLGTISHPDPGTILPNVPGVTLDGTRAVLSDMLDGPCNIIVFFDPKCPWCVRLAEQLAGAGAIGGVPARWVSLPGDRGAVADFISGYNIPGPTLHLMDWRAVGSLGILATPTLYVVTDQREFRGEVSGDEAAAWGACG